MFLTKNFMDYTWDLFVISLFVIAIIYVFGHMLMDTGIPQYYVERYFLTLFTAIVGYQSLFFFLSLAHPDKIVYMFSIPIADLTSYQSTFLLEKLSVCGGSSALIFLSLTLCTSPYLALYNHKFKKKTEFRHNKILIPPFVVTLICVLLLSIVFAFTTLTF